MERKNEYRLREIQRSLDTRDDLTETELLGYRHELVRMVSDPDYGDEARVARDRVQELIDALRAEERARGAHDRGWVMSDDRETEQKSPGAHGVYR